MEGRGKGGRGMRERIGGFEGLGGGGWWMVEGDRWVMDVRGNEREERGRRWGSIYKKSFLER